MVTKLGSFLISIMILAAASSSGSIPAGNASSPIPRVYLPLVTLGAPSSGTGIHRVNVPHTGTGGSYGYDQTAIFWFGQLKLAENYADVRAAYEDWGLWLHLTVYDRYLWYDQAPKVGAFAAWDAVSLYVSPRGDVGSAPTVDHYRFDAMFFPGDSKTRTPFQASFRGNGSEWAPASGGFSSKSTYRGGGYNNGSRSAGWTLTYYVPYTSLGRSGPPAPGTVWGMGFTLHDRDDATGSPIPDQHWPPDMRSNTPSTWGQLSFGLPTYSPRAVSAQGTVTIKNESNGARVPDAAVGGTFIDIDNEYLCPGTHDEVWSQWGEKNFAAAPRLVIQNQGDVSDLSCFAKYYITFPLDSVPAGKAIISASLTMQQFGNSDPSQAKPSYIQVMTADRDWSEETLTWNSAPLAAANFGGAWVDPIGPPLTTDWTPVNRTWDVSLPAVQAYASGQPLRLILYDSDWDMHSGKYFESSQSTAWGGAGRPTLSVTWGNP